MMRVSAILLFFALGSFSAACGEALDLRGAERLALERNLELRAETFDTRAGEASVRKGYGIYDPMAGFDLSEGDSRERISSQVLNAERKSEDRRFDFSLVQRLPSGADLSLGFDNLRNRTGTDPRPAIDPSYRSELRLDLVQPLLKGFGRTVTEQEILFAVHDRGAAVQDLREKAVDILARVRDAYFDVLRYRDELAYRKTSIALAEKVLEENRAKVDAGLLPPVDVLEAEVGLTRRERDLLDTGRAYEDALDALALLLNLGEEIAVADEALGMPEVEADEESGYRLALAGRPDILRRLNEIERLNLDKRLARDEMRPQLDLRASYGHMGLREDYSDDLDDIAGEDFRSWEVGLTFSYPLGNREARNEYLRSRLLIKGEHALLGQLRQEVRTEIRSALRLLEVSGNKVEVAGRGEELAEEKLRMLITRKDVGLATTREVLEGEDDLAGAHIERISSLAEYNKAITEYLRVTGSLLEHEGVRFTGSLDSEAEGPLLKKDF